MGIIISNKLKGSVHPGDRRTVQKVLSEIYKASCREWILVRQKLHAMFSGEYEHVAEFDALAGEIDLGDTFVRDTGFIVAKHLVIEEFQTWLAS